MQVEVSVAHHEGNLRIAAKDYSSGIPESARATLFHQFTQVDSSAQRKKGGSGLGLSITKMIVEAHGGHIDFTSALDKGAASCVDLLELKSRQALLRQIHRVSYSSSAPNFWHNLCITISHKTL
jgi:signal transduction histidine kinase